MSDRVEKVSYKQSKVQERGIQTSVQSAKYNVHRRFIYPVSKVQKRCRSFYNNWSTSAGGVQSRDICMSLILDTCSLLFLLSGQFQAGCPAFYLPKILKNVCSFQEAGSFPIKFDLSLNVQFKQLILQTLLFTLAVSNLTTEVFYFFFSKD